jgi:7,8-dihydroneopterin aldolase/epimerase/oxygenase
MSYEIKLEGLSFHAFHGVYDYERKAGNTFLVDVSLQFPISRLATEDDLSLTPDYQALNEIVKEEMGIPRQLLETLARGITSRLWNSFPDAVKIRVSIKKANPPLGNVCAFSSVVLETEHPL